MAIILEGFDNSGKSTLAASFGLDVIHPGPRPKNFFEERRYLETQQDRANKAIVMDRVTSVSTPMYSGKAMEQYVPYFQQLIRTTYCVVIYCRPSLQTIMDFRTHDLKPYDTEEKMKWLQKHGPKVVRRYDDLMATVPVLMYDWENPNRVGIQMAYDAQFSVGAWQKWQRAMALQK